jgi:hypothetical protein
MCRPDFCRLSKKDGSNSFNVYFNDVFVGKLNIDKAMLMRFIYDDVYMEQGGPAISLAIPTSIKQH